jgi:GntR family transcriptional repressor for pyruvate dehydrogenase complex
VPELVGEPIERPNTYELLAQRLLDSIASGEIADGDPLPSERELVERFGVGRSSVREALRTLQSKGLIHQRGKGRFVTAEPQAPVSSSLQVLLELHECDRRELFEIRSVLEGETAAFAAERRSDEDLVAIAATVEQMAANLDTAESYIDGDLQFHLAIARACRNRFALHMMHAIRDVLRLSLLAHFEIPGAPETSVAHHRAIYAAIAARDPETARRRMHEHLSGVAAVASPATAD